MPGTARLAFAATALVLLAFAAPLAQHHTPRSATGIPVAVTAALATQAVSPSLDCANCII